MNAIDLFCGAGGLTLGLKQAGFRVLAGIDIDSVAIETYRANHPDVAFVIEEDIRKIVPEEVMRDLVLRPGELDLLAGCPPCQGFSTLRTRKKASVADDGRNDLVFEYLRFVVALLPKAVMLENVPGLASDTRAESLLARLGELGYVVTDDTVRIEDAADYGVPQRRKRMIMLATRFGAVKTNAEKKRRVTVRRAFSAAGLARPGMSGDPLHDYTVRRSEKVMSIIRAIPKNGGSRTDLPEHLQLPCHRRYPDGFRDVYGRMSWDDVAPTITGGCVSPSKGRFVHPEENRAITLREAALLQTFPKNYWFSMRGGRDNTALLIGNALPPEFIRRHAMAIRKILERHDQRR